jgi:hypothetical protein
MRLNETAQWLIATIGWLQFQTNDELRSFLG